MAVYLEISVSIDTGWDLMPKVRGSLSVASGDLCESSSFWMHVTM